MNQTEFKYYVYTLNGLLYNRIDFKKEQELYGVPIATSMNGQNFIFKKPRHSLRKLDDEDKIKQLLTISVMHLSAFGITHIKDISLLDSMQALNKSTIVEKPKKGKKMKRTQKELDCLNQNV